MFFLNLSDLDKDVIWYHKPLTYKWYSFLEYFMPMHTTSKHVFGYAILNWKLMAPFMLTLNFLHCVMKILKKWLFYMIFNQIPLIAPVRKKRKKNLINEQSSPFIYLRFCSLKTIRFNKVNLYWYILKYIYHLV